MSECCASIFKVSIILLALNPSFIFPFLVHIHMTWLCCWHMNIDFQCKFPPVIFFAMEYFLLIYGPDSISLLIFVEAGFRFWGISYHKMIKKEIRLHSCWRYSNWSCFDFIILFWKLVPMAQNWPWKYTYFKLSAISVLGMYQVLL